MKVLLFAPAPSARNPNMAPFILGRIVELQKLGVRVEVLQFGNVRRRALALSARRGPARLAENAVLVPLHLVKRLFFPVFALKMRYARNGASYVYYNQIDYDSPESFAAWFRRRGFDLIHAHFLWYAGALPELKERFGIPYVVTAHGSDVHEAKGDPALQRKYAAILGHADHAAFVSAYLEKTCRQFGFGGENSSVIHNGFDPAVFRTAERRGRGAFPVLGFVGHTISVKRVEILPDVLLAVKRRFPDARLCVVGFAENPKDDLRPLVKRRAEELGIGDSVTFAGKVLPEKIPEYMSTFDVLLLPSRAEGFGCVALEARACGVGVVGAANGGIPEAIGDGGTAVAESGTFAEDFSDAVVAYLERPLAREAVRASTRKLTWEDCARKELAMYEKIVSKNGENRV